MQLDAIRAEQGGAAEAPVDGGPSDSRPLAVVLAENKQAKEDAFQEQWKQMKTGDTLQPLYACRTHYNILLCNYHSLSVKQCMMLNSAIGSDVCQRHSCTHVRTHVRSQ